MAVIAGGDFKKGNQIDHFHLPQQSFSGKRNTPYLIYTGSDSADGNSESIVSSPYTRLFLMMTSLAASRINRGSQARRS
jgi:hypothetical protein